MNFNWNLYYHILFYSLTYIKTYGMQHELGLYDYDAPHNYEWNRLENQI